MIATDKEIAPVISHFFDVLAAHNRGPILSRVIANLRVFVLKEWAMLVPELVAISSGPGYANAVASIIEWAKEKMPVPWYLIPFYSDALDAVEKWLLDKSNIAKFGGVIGQVTV